MPGVPDPGSEPRRWAPLDDPSMYRLLGELVALAPTNLEDPVHGRWEKAAYPATARHLADVARAWGLSAQVFDPLTDLADPGELHGIPRPNVVVDLDVGARERVLILAHYDVMPVPVEQLDRWKSPPHRLTVRDDGRWYGRGANDDLGSGAVSSLLPLKRLRAGPAPPRNARLLLCCDEEKGGTGGIEALKRYDRGFPTGDQRRLVEGDVALIPDGSTHTTAGSCGVAFLDGSFRVPVSLPRLLAFAQALVHNHDRVRASRSSYPSPDWPDHDALEPVITGRFTVTKLDGKTLAAARGALLSLAAIHAETDATNQIAQSVTLLFEGPSAALRDLPAQLRPLVPVLFRLEPTRATALPIPAGTLALSMGGRSAHGGYPHRGKNPVPATLDLLEAALQGRLLDPIVPVEATVGVDLRLIPEMPLAQGIAEALDPVRDWIAAHEPEARMDAPADRARGGYRLPMDHPVVRRLARILAELLGDPGAYGEYGGTDASSLADVLTPAGDRIPAVVFGSMDRAANIHEAEESVDPHAIERVADAIYRCVAEP